MDILKEIMAGRKIGAAIRRVSDMEEAIRHPNIGTIFLLGGDINLLPAIMKKIRSAKKNLLVHMDLLEGIGKDQAGIHLLNRLGVPGIVTTKTNLIKYARNEGIWAIQRLFIVDSESLKTAIRITSNVKPTAVEILPATVPRYVIENLKKTLQIPVLGGGLLKTEDDIREALDKGIEAVSTSLRNLWEIKL